MWDVDEEGLRQIRLLAWLAWQKRRWLAQTVFRLSYVDIESQCQDNNRAGIVMQGSEGVPTRDLTKRLSNPTTLEAKMGHNPNPSNESEQSDSPPKEYESSQLLLGAKEILIRHAGEVYRLRLTKNDKLILQK